MQIIENNSEHNKIISIIPVKSIITVAPSPVFASPAKFSPAPLSSVPSLPNPSSTCLDYYLADLGSLPDYGAQQEQGRGHCPPRQTDD
jgi:hypothetical protein